MMTPQSLRIVYLIGQLGLGGSERQLYLLLKHMDGKCFERHVVVFNPSPNYTLDDDLRRAGVTVHTLPAECKGIHRRMLWIFKLLRQLKPHVVHSWSIHDNVYSGLVGRLARVPRRLGSVRGSLKSQDFLQFSPWIRWLILHSVQGLLVNSESIAKELLFAGVPRKQINVLTNCVEIYKNHELAELFRTPANGRLVVMVANLRQEKNHILFVRGIAKILPEFPDLYGFMVGQPVWASDPLVPDQIQSEIVERGAQEHVFLSGFHANVPAILPQFEIFCITSNSEGTPNAVLEAMAAGLPVIATNVGGIPCIVQDGITGLLVEAGDENGFADALRALLNQPENARQMGLSGRRRIEREFSCGTISRAFEEYYLSQFGGEKSAPPA